VSSSRGTYHSALNPSLSHSVGIKVLAELKQVANFLSVAAWAEILRRGCDRPNIARASV
jgi:hypothetical protein